MQSGGSQQSDEGSWVAVLFPLLGAVFGQPAPLCRHLPAALRERIVISPSGFTVDLVFDHTWPPWPNTVSAVCNPPTSDTRLPSPPWSTTTPGFRCSGSSVSSRKSRSCVHVILFSRQACGNFFITFPGEPNMGCLLVIFSLVKFGLLH